MRDLPATMTAMMTAMTAMMVLMVMMCQSEYRYVPLFISGWQGIEPTS